MAMIPRRFHQALLIGALGLLVLVCSPAPARPGSGLHWSDRELASFSELIVTGRVASIASAWDTDAGGIYTYVTLDVAEVLKGWVPRRQIVLKQLGGRVGDLAFVVSDQASFATSEEVLVFLEVRPRDRTLYTSATWQGKWTIAPDRSGHASASREDPSVRDVPWWAERETRSVEYFRSRIRGWNAEDWRAASPAWINVTPAQMPRSDTSSADAARAAFTFLGPARWREPDQHLPIGIDAQEGGQPGLAGGGVEELQTAVALWNHAGATLRLTPGSFRGARCFDNFERNGRIVISFMDPCGEVSDSGGIIAIGGGWATDAETTVVNGVTFMTFLHGDIVNNDSPTALSVLTSSRCFQDVQTHELGHTVGLGHSDQATAIMFPLLDQACRSPSGPVPGRRTGALGPDDVAGLRFIYPPSVPEPPRDLTFTATSSTTTARRPLAC